MDDLESAVVRVNRINVTDNIGNRDDLRIEPIELNVQEWIEHRCHPIGSVDVVDIQRVIISSRFQAWRPGENDIGKVVVRGR